MIRELELQIILMYVLNLLCYVLTPEIILSKRGYNHALSMVVAKCLSRYVKLMTKSSLKKKKKQYAYI